MQAAVQEIDADYQGRLDAVRTGTAYDVLEMSGSRAVWPEVLAVYAVKMTAGQDAQDVIGLDNVKRDALMDIFWQMNEIDSRTETQTEAVIVERDDGKGNIVETEITVTRTTLYITVSHKTAEEMADQLGFTESQRVQMAELLADENSSLWNGVLYGIRYGAGSGDMAAVALSQVGQVGGKPYWSWYGFESHVEWCACFVSWCANECGYIDTGAFHRFASCRNGVQWFQERGQWKDHGYEPQPGDIIFFDWYNGKSQDGVADHVGIVEKAENGMIYTVEGNVGDACRQCHYQAGDGEILGYGILNP